MKQPVFKPFVLIFALVGAAALSGCASQGVQQLREESETTVSTKIVKGQSGKNDIRAAFGDPSETTFTDSGNEIWRYRYTYMMAKPINFVPIANLFSSGSDVDKKELVILFDESGIVKNYSMQSSKEEIKTGILPQK